MEAIQLRRPFSARRGRTACLTVPFGGIVVAGALCLTLMSVTGETVSAAASRPAARATMSTASSSLLPPHLPHDARCHPVSPTPGIITQQALAQGTTPGFRVLPRDRILPCAKPGIEVPTPLGNIPQMRGQLILISVTREWLWAFQDGRLVFSIPVTTGRPGLRTPLGTYTIQSKAADLTFYSPWPAGSPNYYAPEHVNYALNFLAGGFYIHDELGRQGYGPGSENPHTNPDGSAETGTHGCVNIPPSGAAWLYGWARVGATVIIR